AGGACRRPSPRGGRPAVSPLAGAAPFRPADPRLVAQQLAVAPLAPAAAPRGRGRDGRGGAHGVGGAGRRARARRVGDLPAGRVLDLEPPRRVVSTVPRSRGGLTALPPHPRLPSRR